MNQEIANIKRTKVSQKKRRCSTQQINPDQTMVTTIEFNSIKLDTATRIKPQKGSQQIRNVGTTGTAGGHTVKTRKRTPTKTISIVQDLRRDELKRTTLESSSSICKCRVKRSCHKRRADEISNIQYEGSRQPIYPTIREETHTHRYH